MRNGIRRIFCAAALLGIIAGGASYALADGHGGHGGGTTVITVTSAGNISAYNYDDDGNINGFAIGNVVLSFESDICAGISSLGVLTNFVTYSGTATTNSLTGVQSVSVTNFTNSSTGATYTSTPSTPIISPYGPTVGSVTDLNYGSAGNINGFIFTPTSGPVVLVVTGQDSNTLDTVVKVGASVTVTGTTSTSKECVVPASTVVKASTLLIGSTTIVISNRH